MKLVIDIQTNRVLGYLPRMADLPPLSTVVEVEKLPSLFLKDYMHYKVVWKPEPTVEEIDNGESFVTSNAEIVRSRSVKYFANAKLRTVGSANEMLFVSLRYHEALALKNANYRVPEIEKNYPMIQVECSLTGNALSEVCELAIQDYVDKVAKVTALTIEEVNVNRYIDEGHYTLALRSMK